MSRLLDLDEAVLALSSGGVVALPTDTVYGLAASLSYPRAVEQLFSIKLRPSNVALPVLVDSVASIEALGVSWSSRASRLSDSFWPGALTIVVDVPDALATLVGSTTGTVGFRVPHDDVLRGILVSCGPLAVSSANEHGDAPCHSAVDVSERFSDSTLAGVLDGGDRSAEVSTVVRVDELDLHILRQGSIAFADLQEALA
jgi:L-threonylcarbamoyladenylate synthase